LGVQALYFILLGRLLGSKEYGVLAGAVTFVSLFSQYSAAGSGAVFLRYVSIDHREAPRYCGNILLSLGIFGTVLIVAIAIGGHYVLDSASASIVAIIAVSDCLFRQIAVTVAQMFQAYERMKITALLTTVTNGCRLLAVFVLLSLLHKGTAVQWAWVSSVVSGLAAVASVVLALRQIRRLEFSLVLFRQRFKEGIGFSFAASTNSIYNDVDKTLLSHFGMNVANGIYSSAYRVIDIATTPMWALYSSALPSMFREGKDSLAGTKRTVLKILKSGVAAGVVGSALCYFGAPLFPVLMGKSFAASTQALHWLALLPPFRAFALSAGAGLTASGYQQMRTIVQLIAAAFNLGINLYLIPRYSWLGAAWSSLLTDAFLGLGNWVMYLALQRREASSLTT
jgi:O-antigen/teichoic acid export membrane protein